jgi:hypothetical protein
VAQPVLGLIHHERFRRLQRRQIWSYLHLFNGRIPITLGIVNGALGLWIARESDRLKVAYLATAGAMWYVIFAFLFPFMGVICSRDTRAVPELLPRLPMPHVREEMTDMLDRALWMMVAVFAEWKRWRKGTDRQWSWRFWTRRKVNQGDITF